MWYPGGRIIDPCKWPAQIGVTRIMASSAAGKSKNNLQNQGREAVKVIKKVVKATQGASNPDLAKSLGIGRNFDQKF